MMVKVREDRSVRNRACYLAIGVDARRGARGPRDLVAGDRGRQVLAARSSTTSTSRGVEDVLIACVDGLKGFPEAIEAVFPQAWVQTCIVHLIRSSLRYVSYKDRKTGRLRPAADLHRRQRRGRAEAELETLRRDLGQHATRRSPGLARRWEHVIPFLALPADAAPRGLHDQQIESLHRQIRKSDQDPRALPRRAGRHQADLPRDHAEPSASGRSAYNWTARTARPQDPLRRPTPRLTPCHHDPQTNAPTSHTVHRTVSPNLIF